MKIISTSIVAITLATVLSITAQADLMSSDNQILILANNNNIVNLNDQQIWQQQFISTLKQYNPDTILSAQSYFSEPSDIPTIEHDMAKTIWEHGVEKAYVVNLSSTIEKAGQGYCQVRADIDIKGYKAEQKQAELINRHSLSTTQGHCEQAKKTLEQQAELYAANTLQQWQGGVGNISTPVSPVTMPYIPYQEKPLNRRIRAVSNPYYDTDFDDASIPEFVSGYRQNLRSYQYNNRGSRFDNGFD